MSDFEPSIAGPEANRSSHAEYLKDLRREEALRPSIEREDAAHRLDQGHPRIEQGNAVDGDSVAVTANRPQSANDAADMTPENARQLAEDTRERILESPQDATEAVRDTAQEPASSRISRAIDALN
ncbi:hypothetical protein LRD18_03945 [Halorhodospira halochloris]|uniref:Uncharacterized protein n=1 Tax=Halorhodospira halochloris TaxID=1052 RepID=A0A0X8XBL5_HALHR|nr:hypothetical protein [Halorhodospira halochloris]MBK1651786.1 hypothetical protein [Halorhodospira halochloris]MCG5530024.1 hypothetical protein [Halorhodospira halochloris]MCG5548297.1 hypothetical protein [Halorhodospira halochloris]BAU58879.1 hypothetical protein HH1059_21700 [Halorhodospira halochloris]